MTAPGIRPPGTVPAGGAWLRILLAAASTVLCLVIAQPIGATVVAALQLATMVALGGWSVWRPGSVGPLLLLVTALAVRLVFGRAEVDGSLYAMVALVPLVHQLAALAAVVPPRSRLSLRALAPSLLRYLTAVLVAVLALLITELAGWG